MFPGARGEGIQSTAYTNSRDGREPWLSARTLETGVRPWGCCCHLQKCCVRGQVTLHTTPPGSLCSPPLTGSRYPGTTSPGERTARLRLLQRHAGLWRRRLAPPPLYPSLPAAWVSQSPQSSCSFNPVLSGWGTDALRRPTRRGGSKSKADPQELCEQRREGEISPSSLRSSGLKLHKQLDVMHLLNT